MHCLRCPDVAIEPLTGGESAFFGCPSCGRHFRLTGDGELVERWLGPLSLVLYPVIFETKPQQSAERIASELYASSEGKRSIFRPFSREELRDLLREMRLELQDPTQRVREIHDLRAEEADLREYLALVARRLGELTGEPP